MSRVLFGCICVIAIFAVGACGGGAANQPAADTGQAEDTAGDTGSGPAGETGDAGADVGDDEPEIDPYQYRKIKADPPEGWRGLGKDGVFELHREILKDANGHELLAKFSDEEHPHASSGTDEEWAEWAETVSAVFIYNVSKSEEDPVAMLESIGGDFIDGFDSSAVREQQGVAVYTHPDDETRRAACVSNANGTYVLAALVRSDEAGDLLKTYPMSIQPE